MAAPVQTSIRAPNFIQAFSLASGATLAAILFAVGTNKIVAVFGGPESLAMVAIYRNLGAFLTMTAALGYGTLVIQRISAARSSEQFGQIGWATLFLLGLQSLLLAVIALLAARSLAGWLFGWEPSAEQILGVRIVVGAAFVNLALQQLRNALNRSEHLEALSLIQVAVAASSCLLIYPLLRLGNLGLAANVASGAVLGLTLSAYYFGLFFSEPMRQIGPEVGIQFLKDSFRPSLIFVLQAVISVGCTLSVQKVVNLKYGLSALGMLSAALLISETLGMVMVAPVRTYFLPELNALTEEAARQTFFQRMAATLLCLAILASLGILVLSEFSVRFLFSSKFGAAAPLTAVCGLSMLGQAVAWSCHLLLLHGVSNKLIVVLDATWCLGVLALTYIATRMGLPLASAAWAYVLGYWVYGLAHVLVVRRIFGPAWLSPQTRSLIVLGSILVAGCYALSLRSFPLMAVACSLGMLLTFRRMCAVLASR